MNIGFKPYVMIYDKPNSEPIYKNYNVGAIIRLYLIK